MDNINGNLSDFDGIDDTEEHEYICRVLKRCKVDFGYFMEYIRDNYKSTFKIKYNPNSMINMHTQMLVNGVSNISIKKRLSGFSQSTTIGMVYMAMFHDNSKSLFVSVSCNMSDNIRKFATDIICLFDRKLIKSNNRKEITLNNGSSIRFTSTDIRINDTKDMIVCLDDYEFIKNDISDPDKLAVWFNGNCNNIRSIHIPIGMETEYNHDLLIKLYGIISDNKKCNVVDIR